VYIAFITIAQRALDNERERPDEPKSALIFGGWLLGRFTFASFCIFVYVVVSGKSIYIDLQGIAGRTVHCR
jgi:hypothetical protein